MLGLAFSLAVAPLTSLAAPPAEAAVPVEPPAAGNVAILKFDGDAQTANDLRARIQASLAEQGYTANFIERSIQEMAHEIECKVSDASCLDEIGADLNENSSIAYDDYAWVDMPASGVATITIYSIAAKQKVLELTMMTSSNDFILAEVIGGVVARRLGQTQVPPAPATKDEQAIIATLDEPAETPEEIAAREAALAAAMHAAELDLCDVFADVCTTCFTAFMDICRTGPREDKEIVGDDGKITKERDLRPSCKLGPVFGTWQPRAWVTLALTLGSAATMGTMYGLAAVARSDWRAAKHELEASGLSDDNPYDACNADGVCYQDLAGAVSGASAQVQRRAIVGDVFLGATVLLTGVLAIIVWQDRRAAKEFIAREKELRALSNLKIGPVFGHTHGAALGFDF